MNHRDSSPSPGDASAADLYRETVHRFLGDLEEAQDPKESIIRFKEETRRLEEDLERESARPRRILVIGGAGYIGSVLVRRLLERDYRVRVLDALLYENEASLEGLSGNSKFEFLQGDFLERETLHAALAEVTDVVILAALVGDPICKTYPEQAQQINYHGAVGVLEALSSYNINKVVFTSTCSNYGIFEGTEPATEEAPLNPISIYAETKVAVEKYVMERKGQVGYSPTVLRLATAFGLGYRNRFDLTVNHFTRDLALGKELVVFDQDTWRPYCHVEDISQAIIRVLEYPRELVEFQVFNVGGNDLNYSKRQIVELVQKVTSQNGVSQGDVKFQEGGTDRRDYQVDFSKIRDVLGFVPERSASDCAAELAAAIGRGQFADVDARETFYGNYRIAKFDDPYEG